ncbi:monocarboxylate transporter 12-like [Mercenaria mercenaria]|uniref:monocarboxylate transporter 12-like n=1 Tax=Mercenaria mercenaria TaxID=6596 RepID=UPI00234E3AF2|nr:monocarboxylate transporter 12-like [Mercenaria mercenaria]
MYMFVVGSVKAYGVLYTEMVDYYSSGSGNTAWIGSIARTLYFGLGPVANLLCKFYTFRRVAFTGGILVGLGHFLSGFVTEMEFMYLTFLMIGIGYGLTFAPCSTIISYYFDKRRALANGIMVSGSGVGAMALPFLYKYLTEQYGLSGAFWIIGATFANICVAACTFRQPRYLVEEQRKREHARGNASNESRINDGRSSCEKSHENTVQKANKRPCAALDLRISLFKNALFTLYVISFMCCAFGYTGSFILIPANVKALGYDKTYVALSVTIFGGVEVVARILIRLLADYTVIKRKHIYAVSMLIGGAFSLSAPLFKSFTFMAVYATASAMFPGSYFSLISVLTIDVVGLENFAAAFGLLTFCLAFGSLPSQPIIGWLYDLNGNWHLSFILTGCMYILAGVIILLEPIVVRCCSKTDNKTPSLTENQQQDDGRATEDECKDDVESNDTSFTHL